MYLKICSQAIPSMYSTSMSASGLLRFKLGRWFIFADSEYQCWGTKSWYKVVFAGWDGEMVPVDLFETCKRRWRKRHLWPQRSTPNTEETTWRRDCDEQSAWLYFMCGTRTQILTGGWASVRLWDLTNEDWRFKLECWDDYAVPSAFKLS